VTHLYPSGVRNFFRVVAPDAIAVAADAELAQQLGLHRVAIADDGPDGAAPSHIAWFRYSARRLGMSTVVVDWRLPPIQMRVALARLRAAHADGLFVARAFSFDPTKLLASLHKAFGPSFPIIGTDFLVPAFPGTYAGIYGVPNSRLPAAGRRFLGSLTHPGPPLSAAYAGEAATVLLAAVARSDGTRADVVRELHRTNERNGILGALRFDGHGDPVTTQVTILRGVADGGLTEFPYTHSVVDRIISPAPATIHP
jgi:ABC-type branched-subunit amino acid transport system substrate-binding protein